MRHTGQVDAGPLTAVYLVDRTTMIGQTPYSNTLDLPITPVPFQLLAHPNLTRGDRACDHCPMTLNDKCSINGHAEPLILTANFHLLTQSQQLVF
jgi:hypothetical protein